MRSRLREVSGAEERREERTRRIESSLPRQVMELEKEGAKLSSVRLEKR